MRILFLYWCILGMGQINVKLSIFLFQEIFIIYVLLEEKTRGFILIYLDLREKPNLYIGRTKLKEC